MSMGMYEDRGGRRDSPDDEVGNVHVHGGIGDPSDLSQAADEATNHSNTH
jgi:hypothetical protein